MKTNYSELKFIVCIISVILLTGCNSYSLTAHKNIGQTPPNSTETEWKLDPNRLEMVRFIKGRKVWIKPIPNPTVPVGSFQYNVEKTYQIIQAAGEKYLRDHGIQVIGDHDYLNDRDALKLAWTIHPGYQPSIEMSAINTSISSIAWTYTIMGKEKSEVINSNPDIESSLQREALTKMVNAICEQFINEYSQ